MFNNIHERGLLKQHTVEVKVKIPGTAMESLK